MRRPLSIKLAAALCLLAVSALGMPAFAAPDTPALSSKPAPPQSSPPADKSEAGKTPSVFEADNPHRKEVYDRARALAKEMNSRQALSLAYIKNGYGTVRAVELVERNIALAVNKCGAENPALKEGIEKRFAGWQDRIHPVIDENRDEMEAALTGGTFKNVSKIRAYLSAVDKAASYADAQMEKKILSTPESCKALMESMKDTEGTLASLLQDVPWYPSEKELKELEEKTGATPEASDAVKSAEDAAVKAATPPENKGADMKKTEEPEGKAPAAPEKPASAPGAEKQDAPEPKSGSAAKADEASESPKTP